MREGSAAQWRAARRLGQITITMRLRGDAALHVVGALQLALRHPGLARTVTGAAVASIAEELGGLLADRVPELAPVIRAGWNPDDDVPVGG